MCIKRLTVKSILIEGVRDTVYKSPDYRSKL